MTANILSHLVSILCEQMMILGLENFVDLPIDPINLDTLALRGCHALYHLEDCLLRNLGCRVLLKGRNCVPEHLQYSPLE